MSGEMTCGCHLEPVNDTTEPCDLCSEAAGSLDGTGWRIVRCTTHEAAPGLLDTLKAAPVIYIDEPTGRVMPGFGKEYRNWLELARAAIREAEKGESGGTNESGNSRPTAAVSEVRREGA